MTKVKRTIRESETVSNGDYSDYIVYIDKDDKNVHINSLSIPIKEWPAFACWVIQTVATLELKERTIELPDSPIIVPEIKNMFDGDDAFYKAMKKR